MVVAVVRRIHPCRRRVALWLFGVVLLFAGRAASVAAPQPPPNDESVTPQPPQTGNARLAACRQDPTWQSVDYEECRALMGWQPRDRWWRHDPAETAFWMDGKEAYLTTCLDQAFAENSSHPGRTTTTRCALEDATAAECLVGEDEPSGFMGHYHRHGQGEVVLFENALTEREAFAIRTLERCVREIFDHKEPFYEVRAFGEDDTISSYGLYNEDGGNYCTFLNGLLQMYLPGVAATISQIIQTAYDELEWSEDQEMPSPDTLGVRTAEFLRYQTAGKLGLHEDDGSVFSISIALSEPADYDGGYFHLATREALFKLPRRSAVVFFSETLHGVTDVLSGERTVFVMELWEDDDVPVGVPRPGEEDFEDHKVGREEDMEEQDAEEEEEEES